MSGFEQIQTDGWIYARINEATNVRMTNHASKHLHTGRLQKIHIMLEFRN